MNKEVLMKKNGGFTLIEVVISMAILSFVLISTTLLITSGTRSYSSLYTAVDIQYESQIVMAQLQDRLLDCNGGVSYNSAQSALFIVNENDDDTLILHGYFIRDDVLYYATHTGDGAAITSFAESLDNVGDIMSDNVTLLEFTPKLDETVLLSGDIKTAFVRGNRNYEASQTVACRAKPFYSGDLSIVLSLISAETA